MLTKANHSLLVGLLWLLPLLVSSFVPISSRTRISKTTSLQYKEYPWEEGSEVNKDESLTKYQEEETLLQINCKAMHDTPLEEVVIPRVQEYIGSFMFKRVLPVQHLQTVPTDDGGLEILFWRPAFDQSHVDGGLRFFIVLPTTSSSGDKKTKKKKDGDATNDEKDEIFFKDQNKNKNKSNNKSNNSNYFQIVVKRQSEGQTCRKSTTEKLVIQAFVKAFVGKDREKEYSTQDPPTHDVCTMESVFHKWMFSS